MSFSFDYEVAYMVERITCPVYNANALNILGTSILGLNPVRNKKNFKIGFNLDILIRKPSVAFGVSLFLCSNDTARILDS